ncbi:MAG TPA: hypothetical protein PLE54_01855 [Burkholderiaceae bacterium]|nr:hypothetical protein [Burkholderiaceae bacterium]HQR69320.1 hypothetical protein [Burkholderiaceae bacterium]
MPNRFASRVLAIAALLLAGPCAHAASNTASAASGTLSTSVNLQFSITIPRFVFLRVGAAASVNTLTYAPTAAQMASGTGVLATGGDTGAGNSDVTVQVTGNTGNVTLTAVTGNPNLVSGGNTMPWSTLTATSPTGSITAPPFNAGSTVLTAVGGVVNQTGSWRYTWTNPPSTVYAAGTYSGTVTYTAAAP